MNVYIVLEVEGNMIGVFNNKEDADLKAGEDLYYYVVEKEVIFKNQKCEDCKHFLSGVQPDGIGWENCEWNYHCSVPLENMFEKK